VSGPEQGSHGCLLEITNGGKQPVSSENGLKRVFLEDGDVIEMTGLAGKKGSGVGFGECIGQLLPAI
jgi:fumarylacetoacetase